MHLFCIHIIYIWVVIKVVGIKKQYKNMLFRICNVWYNVLVPIHEVCRSCKICFVARKIPIKI